MAPRAPRRAGRRTRRRRASYRSTMTGVLSSFRQTKWWAGDVASAPARGPRKVSSMDVTQATTPAVLYAAKSTQDRHDSIPTQLDDAREMAEDNGWKVVDVFS